MQRAHLQRQLEFSEDVRVYRRTLAILEYDAGIPIVRIAENMNVDRSSLHRWMGAFCESLSPCNLLETPRNGGSTTSSLYRGTHAVCNCRQRVQKTFVLKEDLRKFVMRTRTSWILTTLFIAFGSDAGASMILNGGFELPSLGSPNRVAITTLSDWQSSGGFMLLERGVNGTSGIAAFEGQQFVSFGHSGASNDRLFQTFNTVIGGIYTVDFHLASIQGSALQRMRASAFDSLNNLIAFTDSSVTQQNAWVAGTSLIFTAVTSSTRLEFQHTLAADVANVALDNVVVNLTTAAVPEPSSLSILFTGFAGIIVSCFVRRNRSLVTSR